MICLCYNPILIFILRHLCAWLFRFLPNQLCAIWPFWFLSGLILLFSIRPGYWILRGSVNFRCSSLWRPFYGFSRPTESVLFHFCMFLLSFRSSPPQKLPFSHLLWSDGSSYPKTTASPKSYQIKNLLIVNLEVWACDLGLASLLTIGQHLEGILKYSWQNSSAGTVGIVLQVILTAKDRISLSSSSLSIGKNATIISLGNNQHTSRVCWTHSCPIIWYISCWDVISWAMWSNMKISFLLSVSTTSWFSSWLDR